MTPLAAELAAAVRGSWLGRPFGSIELWGFAAARPGDQSYHLVSTHSEGDRLDLVFVHASGAGLPGVISAWEPEGLSVDDGLALAGAARLRLDDATAERVGDAYRLTTPRGVATWPIGGRPALRLR